MNRNTLLLMLAVLLSACMVSEDKYNYLARQNRVLSHKLYMESEIRDSLQGYITKVLNRQPASLPIVITRPAPTSPPADSGVSQTAPQPARDTGQALPPASETSLRPPYLGGEGFLKLSDEITFASNQTRLSEADLRHLDDLAQALNGQYPSSLIMVQGHADSEEQAAANERRDSWAISVDRANTVVRELIGRGVAPERLIAAGRGAFQPQATNLSALGKAKNRRIEIILTPAIY
jgi:outer membrane protein OmpA-like peptidoglycan-associated protein